MIVPTSDLNAWLVKVADDEQSIRAILKADGAPATACFLAQQMAEKLLKALLVAHHRPIRKVHDLGDLAKILRPSEPTVSRLRDDLTLVNRYYSGTRYPSDLPDLGWQDAEVAFEAALRVKSFVMAIIDRMER